MFVPRKLFLIGLICFLAVFSMCQADDDEFDDDDEEPYFKNVVDRKLITPTPSARSILKEHAHHATDTKQRNFLGPTLGYITPWFVIFCIFIYFF
jgi:hypothetical protein